MMSSSILLLDESVPCGDEGGWEARVTVEEDDSVDDAGLLVRSMTSPLMGVTGAFIGDDRSAEMIQTVLILNRICVCVVCGGVRVWWCVCVVVCVVCVVCVCGGVWWCVVVCVCGGVCVWWCGGVVVCVVCGGVCVGVEVVVKYTHKRTCSVNIFLRNARFPLGIF